MRDELINFLMCHGHTKERSEQVADLVCAELEKEHAEATKASDDETA